MEGFQIETIVDGGTIACISSVSWNMNEESFSASSVLVKSETR